MNHSPRSFRAAGNGNDETGPGLASHVGAYAGFGLTLGAATALFAWLGSLLDAAWHTKPLFILLGTLLGFAGGFYSMYWRLVLKDRPETAGENAEDG